MRVALIASPFIPVPPRHYGGTELFIANLAEALMDLGVEVAVYTNGQSTVNADVRWCYAEAQWPLPSEFIGVSKDLAIGAPVRVVGSRHDDGIVSWIKSKWTGKRMHGENLD